MSKTQTSSDSDDVSLPESDDRFNARETALNCRGTLKGTDRQFVRQFIENFNDSLIDTYDPIVIKNVSRSDNGDELRLRLQNTDTTVGYNRACRATRGTQYDVEDMRLFASGILSLTFSHTNE